MHELKKLKVSIDIDQIQGLIDDYKKDRSELSQQPFEAKRYIAGNCLADALFHLESLKQDLEIYYSYLEDI